MPVFRRLLEQRSLNNPSVPLSSAALSEWLDGVPSYTGVKVTEKSAMRLIAVHRCVELIAGTCAGLPIKAYKTGTRQTVAAPVLEDPHPDLTAFEVWEIGYASLLLWGNAYFRKMRDGTGRIRYLWPIQPHRVTVDMIDPTLDNPGGKVFAITDQGGKQVPYTKNEILHIPGLGYDGRVGLSRIQLATQAIGLGMAAEEYAARFYGSGSLQSGILTTDGKLNEEQATTLKARWKSKVGGLANAHEIAVLDSGAKFQAVSISPKDAELIASSHWNSGQIAMLFGLPPHAIGLIEKATSWGTGIEQQTIGMIQYTLQPSYLTRIEQRLTKEVLMNPSVYAEYNVEGLLRGDSKARSTFYAQMVAIRAMNPNEVRARENMEPYDGGDEFLNPNITPQVIEPDPDTIGDSAPPEEPAA